MSWCVLLHNLWGGGGGGRLDDVPLDVLAIGVFTLLALPLLLLGQVAVAGLRACQGCFCAQVFEEEQHGVEMEGLMEITGEERGDRK